MIRALALCAALLCAATGCGTFDRNHARGEDARTSGQEDPDGGQRVTTSANPASNPLFRNEGLGLDTADCTLPEAEPDEDYLRYLRRHLNTTVSCLNNAWKPVMSAAGLPFSAPDVEFHTKYPYDTPCHRGVKLIFSICIGPSAGHTGPPGSLHFQIDDDAFADKDDEPSTPALLLFASQAYFSYQIAATGVPLREDLPSKRVVLEAFCLSGVFVGSLGDRGAISDADAKAVREDTFNKGEESEKPGAENPSDKNSALWLQKGIDAKKVATCNTWAAPDSEVN